MSLLFILLVFLIVTTYHVLFFSSSSYRYIEVYFFFLFYICSTGLIFTGNSFSFATIKTCNYLTIFLGALFFISIFLKLCFLDLFPVGGDEISQMVLARDLNPILGSFSHQQPPLGYFVSALSERFWGVELVSIRIFGLMISSFCMVFLLGIFRLFKVTSIIAILLTVLFFSSPVIFQFSFEFRPYILGLTFTLFLFHELTIAYFNDRHSVINQLRIFCWAVLLNLSLGFQPVVLSVCLILSLWVFDKPRLIPPFIASLIVFLPFQLQINSQSIQYFNFENWIFVLIEFSVLLYLLYLIKRFKSGFSFKEQDNLLVLTGFYFFCFCLFGLISVGLFSQLIAYHLNFRYLTLGLLILVLFFGLASVYCKWSYHMVILGSFCAYLIFFFPTFLNERQRERIDRNTSFQKVLQEMESRPGLFIPLCGGTAMCWDYFYIIEFFSKDRYHFLPSSLKNPIGSILTKLVAGPLNEPLYLYIEHSPRSIDWTWPEYVEPLNLTTTSTLVFIGHSDTLLKAAELVDYIRSNGEPIDYARFEKAYAILELLQLITRKEGSIVLKRTSGWSGWEISSMRSALEYRK
jgi:hypothetical protein